MQDHSDNVEDVAQSDNNNEVSFEVPEVEDLEPLPTPEEAELGELCRVPETQFENCNLLSEEKGELVGFIAEGGKSNV